LYQITSFCYTENCPKGKDISESARFYAKYNMELNSVLQMERSLEVMCMRLLYREAI
jgi:hypothetical protein